MSLLDQAKEDIQDITGSASEFGRSMVFVAPNNSQATVTGLHSKHYLGVDTDGNMINTKNAHVSISEHFLNLQNYPVRVDGKVKMKGHKVTVVDSTGSSVTYKIREAFPNETIGLIVCILGDYE